MTQAQDRPLLLILSSEIAPAAEPGRFVARHAVRSLMQAGEAAGFAVAAGPFDQFQIELPASGGGARLVAGGRALRPAAAILRTTLGTPAMARMIDRTLRAQGCVVLDPEERLTRSAYGKGDLLMSAQGTGCDSDRVVVSSEAELVRRLRAHDYARRGRLVAKPLEGSGGRYPRWVDGSEDSIAAVLAVVRGFGARMPPYVIEPALDIAAEHRIYTLDGAVLGCVRRIAPAPDMAANAQAGSRLVEEPPPPAALAAIRRLMRGGLIGWDVAQTRDGGTVVIEMNRPPTWKHFAQVSAVDIAAAVVARLRARLDAARAAR